MRYIKTTNSQIEFIEATADGNVLSSIGLQLGEVYFQIKNKKATFYLNDSERPFDNYIWSIDVPLTIDGEVYSTEEEASAALSAIMNDSFQEQLDQLKEDLAAEEARAQEAEEQLEDKIDDESARAIAAENRLQDQVTELSGAVAVLDNRVTDVENDLSALTDTVNDEITRSTAKDVSHDALISGLTTNLQNEINRATSAENSLRNDLNAEIQNRIDSISGLTERVADDEAAFGAALVDLNNKINAVSGENASQNVQISGLNNSINTEISRATSVENALRSDLNDEISRATTKENQLDDKIDFEIANRIADVNVEENRAIAAEQALDSKIDNEITRSTAKDASHDTLISGLTTNLQSEINRATSAENSLRNDLNAEITRATDAEEDLDDKIDLEIQNRINAVSGLTERVADDEAAFGAALVDLNNKINAVSGENASQNVQISGLNNSINTEISRATSVENALRSDLNTETSARTAADTAQIERIVALEVGKADKSDLNNYYTKAESDAKYATKDYVSGLTDNFYTKGQTNELLAAKADKTDVIAISGDVIALSTKVDTISGDIITIQEEIDDIDLSDYYTKTESDGKYQLKGDYVTGAQMSAFTYDKQTIDDKIAQGGSFDPTQYYNKNATDALLAQKQNKLTAGTGIDITNDVISVTGGSQPVDAYTKAESDAKFSTITNFNSHSGNTTVHITAQERTTWNAKPNVWCGNESEWSQISGSTESGTIYLVY